MGVVYDEAAERWVATFYDAAGRERVRTKRSRLLAEIAMIRRAGPNSRQELGELRLLAYAHVALMELQERGGCNRTIAQYLRQLELRVPDLLQVGVAHISSVDLGAKANEWDAGKRSANCIRSWQGILEMVLECAWRAHAVDGNAAIEAYAHRRPVVPPTAPAVLPADEDIEAMRAAAHTLRRRTLLEFVLATNSSEQELRALKVEDVDLNAGDTGAVTFQFQMDGAHEVEHPNPFRNRTVPLADARPWLEAWLDSPDRPDSEYVFPNQAGDRSAASTLYNEIRRVQFLAGLPGDPSRRRSPRVQQRVARPYAWSEYLSRYGMRELGNVAVIGWYRDGHRDLALASLVGCTQDGLKRFQPLLDEMGHDHEVVRRAGRMLANDR